MFYKIFVLGLVICAQLFIIDYLFNLIPLKENDNNYEFKKIVIDLSEIVLMVTIASFVLYMYMNDLLYPQKMFTIIFVNVIIILSWGVRNVSWVRDLLGDIDLKYASFPINLSWLNWSESNEKQTRPINNEPDNVIFSKYIKKPSEMLNYSFSELYNRHNNVPKETKKVKDGEKDYSMYNGYPEDHICYGCGCLKRDNGYKFCGKELPGMGVIGCSSRWECRNCKNCESANNSEFNKKYGCDKCKCHKTDAGVICGTKSSLTGYIQKCNSSCAECDVCYGEGDSNSNSNVGYKTIQPSSNLKNVIININKVDVDNLFD